MISQATKDRILDLTKIEEVLGDFMTLKRKGANYWACCPFHNEKTPSFSISPAKGFYKCFGCGKSGTAVGFLMDHEGMSYVEALRYLGKKYGVEVIEKEETAEEIAARKKTESLMLVAEFAQKFYTEKLDSEDGRILGYAYLKSRGMEDETIKNFGLGWAPGGHPSFTETALEAGYKEEYLIEAGFTLKSEDGERLYDRFRERVMFPIRSASGRVIAYSGRTLRSDKEVAKYVNSPESPIYIKSRALFGIDLARGEINRQNKCILVEGNVDVVSMHQLGIRNVVASCGTALTVEQIRLIRKYTDNITVMYDGDAAGQHAADRAVGMILKEGLNVRVVFLPGGQDPDDYARKHTLDEVRSFIEENEQDFVSFKTERLASEAGNDPIKRAGLINEIADTIALIDDSIKRAVYVQTCAAKFGLSEDLIFSRIRVARSKELEAKARESSAPLDRSYEPVPEAAPAYEAPAPAPVTKTDPLKTAEESLLYYVFKYGHDLMKFDTSSPYYSKTGPQTVFDFIDAALASDNIVFSDETCRKAYDAYLEYFEEGVDQETAMRRITDSEDRALADLALRLSVDRYELSLNTLKSTMTKSSTLILRYVPEAILRYHLAMVESRLEEIKEKLKEDLSQQEMASALKDLAENNKIKTLLNQEIAKMNN